MRIKIILLTFIAGTIGLWLSSCRANAAQTNEVFEIAGTPLEIASEPPNETKVDKILRFVGLPPTNYAIEPYFTYAPKAPEKYGGGVLAIYNVNDYVGLDLGLDWLGHLSLVSGNVQLQLPFHPAPKQFPSLIAGPFVLAGIASAYGGAGKFNGNLSTVHDLGASIKFGHLAGGAFNTGIAWGAWDGLGAYDVKRYHVFAGYSHGF